MEANAIRLEAIATRNKKLVVARTLSGYMLLATDGVWDFLSGDEVSEIEARLQTC